MSKNKFDTSILTSKKRTGPTPDSPSTGILVSHQPAAAVAAPEQFPFQSQQIALEEIKPNPNQPRKTLGEESIRELAASIEAIGLIQPIVVVRRAEHYTIIAGERRYQAHVLLGRKTISCIVRPASKEEQEELLLALTENVQREDLKPVEEARAIKSAMEVNDLSQVKIAKQLGKSRKYVQDLLAVIDKLEPQMLVRAQEADLPKSTLVEIASTKGAKERHTLMEKALKSPKGSWAVVQKEKQRHKRAADPAPKTYRLRTTFPDLPGSVTVSIPKDPASVTDDEVLIYLQKAVDELSNQAAE